MNPTLEQIRVAILNTQQKPRNFAPVIYVALKKEKQTRREATTP